MSATAGEKIVSDSKKLMLGGSAVMLVILLLLGIWITRSILRQLGGEPGEAAEIVGKMAEGELSTKIVLRDGDTSSVFASLKQVSDTLQVLMAEMNRMSAEHDKGDIDVAIDANKFKGEYKAMAEGVNTMVFGHIAVKKKAMACIKGFGEGNFDAPLEKFPGKKVFINETIELVRGNIKAVLADTDVLIRAVAGGQLDVRADASKHQGDFRKLVQGVNDTVTNIAEPLKVTSGYVDQIAKGIIPAIITTDYKGEYGVIKNNLNTLVKMMGDLLAQTDIIIQGAANGELDKRADAAMFQGGWNQLVAGVNKTLDGIILPVNEAVAVLAEMEKGDLTKEVKGDYKGQLKDFKDTVNNTIARISQVIGEVRGAADALSSASEQVSATAQSMSQATSE